MGRSPCCDESGLKKGPWTPEEDQKLVKHIQKHGHGSWRALPKLAGLNRCGKSCRLRWTNYLRPDIKRGKFSQEEEQTILNLHSILGNKWSAIATHLPGRTDNEIKNFWNTHLKKKLIQMGFDPMTHRPRTDLFSSLPHLIALANLKELMEHHSWEEVAGRLQTEAVQMAKLQYLQFLFQPAPTTTTSMPTLSNNDISNNNDMTDMETFNLLMNSLSSNNKDSNAHELDTSTNLSSLGSAAFQSMHESIPFAHLPDLQVPCSSFQPPILNNKDMVERFDFTVFSQGESTYSIPTSPWFPSSSSSLSPRPPPIAPPPLAANQGDACSTSSYRGAPQSFWPELLLEDPLFHEIS